MRATVRRMQQERELATWLLGHRREIEQALNLRLGAAAPRAAGPEAETLRRFRTFVSSSLMRGEPAAPALDGLRPDERRVMALLMSWAQCAAELAGPARVSTSAREPAIPATWTTMQTYMTSQSHRSQDHPRRGPGTRSIAFSVVSPEEMA